LHDRNGYAGMNGAYIGSLNASDVVPPTESAAAQLTVSVVLALLIAVAMLFV